MKRLTRMELARETVKIVDRGFYKRGPGQTVNRVRAIQTCLAATRYSTPEDLARLRKEVLGRE